MTDTYATYADLTAALSAAYTAPDEAASLKLLAQASGVVNFHTYGRAQVAWDSDDEDLKADVTRATCEQVEYWLETGEEHDVLGLKGALSGGRLQVQHLPPELGARARRTLLTTGLLYAGIGAN